jgi:uncharacterized membrane protein YgdD (TMEM256/DUF423 family)
VTARTLAAALGFLAVALGAFGAHALRDRMTPEQAGWWSTAVLYHLVHAAAALGSDREGGRATPSAWCFAAGIALFSGTLYAMALGGPRWLGAVTPVGGVALLAGWLLLLRPRRTATP